jgi:hypothetical protein
MTLDHICGKHIILKQKLLIKELHTAIKHLYTAQVIPHLHSCLDEILTTSFLRYEQMNMLKINAYSNKQGAKTNFVLTQSEMKPKVQETLDLMLSYRAFTPA